jgi:phosphatidylinositol phospholipase C delta
VLEFTYNSEEEALSFLRLRIKEDEFGKDDILAIFCARVDLLDSDVDGKTKGWRLIRMLDGKGNWKGATVLARFKISDASTP